MNLSIFAMRLVAALICGILIGLERQLRQRSAGLTTNSLVSVGACIFILISETVIANAVADGGLVNNDNLRVLAQIVTGIGFWVPVLFCATALPFTVLIRLLLCGARQLWVRSAVMVSGLRRSLR